jgi:propionyl-CoA carboxylase alpha chain
VTKILIANRGEIACRVIRTARRMGIATVAVYSDADARAPMSGWRTRRCISGPRPRPKLSDPEKIIAACKATGAEAVHPGYGFLSERASFAEALEAEGIAFIGPPPSAIAAMGDKIESKKLAKEAGVNVVPGFVGEIADTAKRCGSPTEIGYPVMMKAQRRRRRQGHAAGLTRRTCARASRRPSARGWLSFGDDRVFIEKFIETRATSRSSCSATSTATSSTSTSANARSSAATRRWSRKRRRPFVTPEDAQGDGRAGVALAKAVGYYSRARSS